MRLVARILDNLEAVPLHQIPVGDWNEACVASEQAALAQFDDLRAGQIERDIRAEALRFFDILVNIGGEGRPRLRQDDQVGTEGGYVEVHARDFLFLKLFGRLAGRPAHAAADVIPPSGLGVERPLAAGQEDGAQGGVLLRLMKAALALGMDRP